MLARQSRQNGGHKRPLTHLGLSYLALTYLTRPRPVRLTHWGRGQCRRHPPRGLVERQTGLAPCLPGRWTPRLAKARTGTPARVYAKAGRAKRRRLLPSVVHRVSTQSRRSRTGPTFGEAGRYRWPFASSPRPRRIRGRKRRLLGRPPPRAFAPAQLVTRRRRQPARTGSTGSHRGKGRDPVARRPWGRGRPEGRHRPGRTF